MRAVTVTANAAVDVSYLLGRFAVGGVNAVQEVIAGAGGKGNNVARVLARLGHEVTATGFAGGAAGAFIAEALRRSGIAAEFEPIPGESRRCLTVIDRTGGSVTELREPGEPLPAGAAARLIDRVTRLARQADAVAICGSLPPGAPDDLYATLVSGLRSSPVFVALDSSGEPFGRGLEGGPDLIAPNASEMAELIGRLGSVGDAVARTQREVIGRLLPATSRVLLKLGAGGAILVGREWAIKATPPAVAAVNPVGCGDALLAGFLASGAGRTDPAADLAFAVAVGTAAALRYGIGEIDPVAVADILGKVRIESIAPRGEATREWTG